jgi:hypothetical protein
VRTLARKVMDGATDPTEMVQRLVNWFRSDRFHYTTASQPVPPPGLSPVVAFLTQTRTGNCQIFTDAFTLMARSLGIPTRVAVGFTAGSRSPDGVTTVVGADAHTWPEVSLSPGTGWASVEPTPASVVNAAIPIGVLGPGAVGVPRSAPAPSVPPVGTAPTTGTTPTPSVPRSSGTNPSGTGTHTSTRGRPEGGSTPWLVLVLGPGIALLLGACFAKWYRWRRKRRRHGREAVPDAWARCQHALAGVDLACPPSWPPVTHVQALTAVEVEFRSRRNPQEGSVPLDRDGLRDGLRPVLVDLGVVARLDEEARYGGRPLPEAASRRASDAADRVELALRRGHLRGAARALGAATTSWATEHHGTLPWVRASYRCGADDAEGARLGADRTGV